MKRLFVVILFLSVFISGFAQQKKIILDEVVAVVGNKIVKYSDIEAQMNNLRMYGEKVNDNSYCEILERLMISKLYEHQAELDSIFISDAEVELELDRRIRYFIQQAGSQEKLEEYYEKSIIAIKEEFREMVREMMISHTMEGKITEDIRVTPSEVKKFFENGGKDSIPLIPAEFEIQHITKLPKITDAQKREVVDRLNNFRTRILKGERFQALAILYSDDPGSAKKGGELGFFGRGVMYSEFEATAFSLKEGEISQVIETKAGFHILQLIERKGDQVNVRHILIQPKANVEELAKAQVFLDSIAGLIQDSIYTFEEAARLFSDSPDGKTGGYYTGEYSGNLRMTAEEIDPNVFFVIDKFEIGQISKATPFQTDEREDGMQILRLKNRIAPHQAELNTDYDKIYNIALAIARQNRMIEWIEKKIKTMYIKLSPKAQKCQFENDWKI
jgi:peptidyl-prolyl cis-trans isomerase SurA